MLAELRTPLAPQTSASGDARGTPAVCEHLRAVLGRRRLRPHGTERRERSVTGEPVLEVLERNFDSILAPGFTDYFRKSGVYGKEHSRPMYGKFDSLFLDDANYRTDDACKSILVRGDYRFEDRDHSDTFSTDGCFAQLSDDVLLASIGTPWLMCSFLHYVESKHDVPYVYENVYEGTLIDGDESRRVDNIIIVMSSGGSTS